MNEKMDKLAKDYMQDQLDKNREYYTKTQCELINGVPRKEADQDSLDEILTLSERNCFQLANKTHGFFKKS